MSYFIKTIGIRPEDGEPIELAARWNGMLTQTMCFRRSMEQRARQLQTGDRLAVYVIKRGSREFPEGGFVGTLTCMGTAYEDHHPFGPEWSWLVPVRCNWNLLDHPGRRPVTFRDISRMTGWFPKMQAAIRAHFQSLGGLIWVEAPDFDLLEALLTKS